ncbi:MAG: right-handed parallel beta-helix repeat-containing protein [Candidatus Zixiibacteriota bacterium]
MGRLLLRLSVCLMVMFFGFGAIALAQVLGVVIDDDFLSQTDVDVYNSSHGTSYTFGYDAFNLIQEGVDAVADAGVISVLNGTYYYNINIVDRNGIILSGESRDETILYPAFTLDWNVGSYGSSRKTAIRVVNSTDITITNVTLNLAGIAGDNRSGLLYWNSSGSITNNLTKNNTTAGYYEITAYLRAPDLSDAARAQIDITGNTFLNTGRVGIVIHDYVNVNIEDNSFDQVDPDFGYGIELGSMAGGIIKRNSFRNYSTWAATDQSTVSAIYIENSYTSGVPAVDKYVVVDSNDISHCQYGIVVGNQWEGLAGDVDIHAIISNNEIYDNTTTGSYSSGGIIISDEGRDMGSAVYATLDNNLINSNGDYGIYIFTKGNGDISAWLTYNWILNNFKGIDVKEFSTVSNSIYNVIVHHNILDNNLNAENDVISGYWDDMVSVGNCWSDFEGEPGEAYEIPGTVTTIDRYPNIYCGECNPGDANNNAVFNIIDITYIISFLYKDGPAPIPYSICSGDPTVNCEVNLLDIVYLIAYIYKDGPAPGNALDWFYACGGPLRGTPEEGLDDNSLTAGQLLEVFPVKAFR